MDWFSLYAIYFNRLQLQSLLLLPAKTPYQLYFRYMEWCCAIFFPVGSWTQCVWFVAILRICGNFHNCICLVFWTWIWLFVKFILHIKYSGLNDEVVCAGIIDLMIVFIQKRFWPYLFIFPPLLSFHRSYLWYQWVSMT